MKQSKTTMDELMNLLADSYNNFANISANSWPNSKLLGTFGT